MCIYMGVDPGKTTGIAVFNESKLLFTCEAKNAATVIKLINQYRPQTIVMEDFFVRRGKPADYKAPIKLIGVIEYHCMSRDILIVMQSPSILRLALKFVPKDAYGPHERSAIAHVMYYLKIREIKE